MKSVATFIQKKKKKIITKKKKKISCYFLALSLVVDIKVSESAIGSEDDKISYSFWALSIFVYLWRRRWVFSLLLSFCFCGGWFGFDFSWGVFFVFKISVNGERPIPIFWSCFSSIFFYFGPFLVLGGEILKRGVEIHIHPFF